MEVGERVIIIDTYRYAVTTRMTFVLRWAVMRAILMFHNCEGQSLTARPHRLTLQSFSSTIAFISEDRSSDVSQGEQKGGCSSP